MIKKAYHSCLNKNGLNYIKRNAPFLSKKEHQWLSQGYYFWMDVVDWAVDWNKNGVVIRFELDLSYDSESEIFDLSGNGEHVRALEAFAIEYKAMNNLTREPCVSELIEGLRALETFKFQAVKVNDFRKGRNIDFLNLEDRHEKLNTSGRIQMCVFNKKTDEKDLIKFGEVIGVVRKGVLSKCPA